MAPRGDAAGGALRGARRTDITSVKDQPVVRHGQQMAGDIAFEGPLGLQRILRPGGETDALRDAEDVRIDRHHLLLPQHGAQHVGRLAAHARQTLHGLQVARHLAAELLAEHPGHGREVFGLVVRVRDAPDVGIDLLGRGAGHVERGREGLEQGRGGHVHPLVGALRREDHGDKQLIGVFVVQFALGHGHVLREPGDDAVVTLSDGHGIRLFSNVGTESSSRAAPPPRDRAPDAACAARRAATVRDIRRPDRCRRGPKEPPSCAAGGSGSGCGPRRSGHRTRG